MDQVKVVLAVLRKQHFWIECGLVAVVGLVVTFIATTKLSARYVERKGELESKLSRVQAISATEDPPNDKVIEAKNKQIESVKRDVYEAWNFLYQEQKKNNPWPQELGEDFLMMIDKLGPDEEIPVPYLETYHWFIKNHFPALFEIIDRRREVYVDEEGSEHDMKTAPPSARELKREVRGKVVWENPEVLQLGRTWKSRPTTFEVRLAQENLWVYEALLRIIRSTNEGATSYYNAPVKRIEALQIGKVASAAFAGLEGRIIGGRGSEGYEDEYGEGEEEDEGYEGEGEGYDEYDQGDQGGSGQDQGSDSDYYRTAELGQEAALRQGRYVNLDGKPLAADAEPFAEFKMMPVRMLLHMDQRKIPDLLANCANSSMPVEPRRVTLSMGESLRGQTGGSFGGGGYDDYESEEGYGGGGEEEEDGEGRYERGYRGGGGGTSSRSTEYGPFDIPVEILGIIQIYNRPDQEKVGTGLGEEEAETVEPLKAPPEAPATPAKAQGPAAPPEAVPPKKTPPKKVPSKKPAPSPAAGT